MKDLDKYMVELRNSDNDTSRRFQVSIGDLKNHILKELQFPDPADPVCRVVPGEHVPDGYIPAFSEDFSDPVYIQDGDDRKSFGALIDSFWRWRVRTLEGNGDDVVKHYVPGLTHLINGDNKLILSASSLASNARRFVGGMVSTERTFFMRYGYWETRLSNIVVPKGYHLSAWLLREDGRYGDVAPREIDMIEVVNDGTPNTDGKMFFNDHPNNGQKITKLDRSSDDMVLGFWSRPNDCRWYVNDVMVRKSAIDLKEPMYFLITWEGNSKWPGPIENADAVASVEVDYISAFKPKPSGKEIGSL